MLGVRMDFLRVRSLWLILCLDFVMRRRGATLSSDAGHNLQKRVWERRGLCSHSHSLAQAFLAPSHARGASLHSWRQLSRKVSPCRFPRHGDAAGLAGTAHRRGRGQAGKCGPKSAQKRCCRLPSLDAGRGCAVVRCVASDSIGGCRTCPDAGALLCGCDTPEPQRQSIRCLSSKLHAGLLQDG